MLAEVRAALPAIHAAATAPAGKNGVGKVIAAKFTIYPQPLRNKGEWDQFWDDYSSILEGFALSALEAAMAACLADPKIEFLPKPAKIAEMARMTPNRAVRAYDRAKAAVDYEAPRQIERVALDLPKMVKAPSVATQADKDRVKRMSREFIEQDDARKKALAQRAADMAPVSAPTDEAGVSAGMRELLNRKRGEAA